MSAESELLVTTNTWIDGTGNDSFEMNAARNKSKNSLKTAQSRYGLDDAQSLADKRRPNASNPLNIGISRHACFDALDALYNSSEPDDSMDLEEAGMPFGNVSHPGDQFRDDRQETNNCMNEK